MKSLVRGAALIRWYAKKAWRGLLNERFQPYRYPKGRGMVNHYDLSGNHLTRRAFIGSGTVAAVAAFLPRRGVGGESSCVAAYYEPYLTEVSRRIRAHSSSCDTGFFFVTDQHVKSNCGQSGRLVAELIRRTGIVRVFSGGDLVEAFGEGYPTDKAAVDFAIDGYRRKWVSPIRAAGGRLYSAKGNHDFTVRHSMDSDEPVRGYTMGGAAARDLIVGEWTERDIVSHSNDPCACYYYHDDVGAKIRFVVLDTTDSEDSGDVAWGVRYGVHDRQLAWLAEVALGSLPSDYDLVVMHHIPLTGVVGNERETSIFANLRDVLEAYQNRGRMTIAGRTYDFARATGRILVDLTGHHHSERQTFQNGILHVTEPCDAAYEDYIVGSMPWCGALPKKVRGTIAEQTFDVVQISRDRRLLHFTRVGGGQGRTIHCTAKKLKVGETLKLEPEVLSGKVSFACYDGDSVTRLPNPKNRWNKLVAYKSDFATIASDGTLTAKAPGPVMVVLRTEGLEKELYPLIITPA